MRTATLGTLEVPVVGIGCNNFGRALDARGSKDVVNAAFAHGTPFFDTAANYGNGQSERFLGAAIGKRRAQAIIATKFGMPRPDEPGGGAAPDYVKRSAERSLIELGTDYIDLYQLHKPDPETPIADTLGAMWDLVDAGLVREIGCSNLDATQLSEAIAVAHDRGGRRFVANQVQYSLVHREPEHDGLTTVCATEGVALLPYYPLANGLLTGKVRRGEKPQGRLSMDRYQSFLTDRNYCISEAVVEFASSHGLTAVQAALGWLLSRPTVPAVTPGATRAEQVGANAAAAGILAMGIDFENLGDLVEGC